MSDMTSRERFIAAMKREEVDRVPIGPPFQGYWALEQMKVSVPDSISDPKKAAEAQISIVDKTEMDGFETMWDWLCPAEAMGCTPDIVDIGSPSTAEHIVSDPSVLDKMEVPDPSKDYRAKSAYECTEHIIKHYGDDKYYFMTLVCPFTLVGELRGVENLMMDLFDQPDFVKDMLKLATEAIDTYTEYFIGCGTDGFCMADPTASGDLIGKEDFEQFAMPYSKACIDKIRKMGGSSILHICGNTSDRLGAIADIIPDVFSMDALVDIGVAKQEIGDRVALLGNVNPAETMFAGTKEEVLKETEDCIKKTDGKGHILGAGCDIAPGTPMENVLAWKEVIQKI